MTDAHESRPGGEVVVYEAPNGEVQLNVGFDQDTVWLTQRQMAETCSRRMSWTSGQLLRIS